MSSVDKEAIKAAQTQTPSNGQRPPVQPPSQFPATPDPETALALGLAQRRQSEFNKKVQTALVLGYLQSSDTSVTEVLDVLAIDLVDQVLLPATIDTIKAIPGAIAQLPQSKGI